MIFCDLIMLHASCGTVYCNRFRLRNVSSGTLNSTMPYHTNRSCLWRTDGQAGGWCWSVTTITRNWVHQSSQNWVCRWR